MSKVLEKIVSGSHKVLDGMNNFYDTKSEKWYVEAAKHLVPSYTVNRINTDFGGNLITDLAAGTIELGKLVVYGALVIRAVEFFR